MPCCEICGQFACLHVKKNASIDGNLYVSGASSLQGSNSFGISNFTSDVDVQGVTTLVGDVSTESDLSVAGNVSIDGNLTVTGTILPQESLIAVKTATQDISATLLPVTVTWGNVTGTLEAALNPSTGVFTAPATGIYSVTITVSWGYAENSGFRALGVSILPIPREGCVSALSFVELGSTQAFSGTFAVEKDDTMNVYVRSNVMTSLNFDFSSLEITRVR